MAINYSDFPNLGDDCRVTSYPDRTYNCIAWAAGVCNEWWEAGLVWPDELPQDDSLDTLKALFELLGFVDCGNDDTLEPGFEKVAIYAKEGAYEHAARQLPDGKWTSKLGPDDDIEHSKPESVAGGLYGELAGFLKRVRR